MATLLADEDENRRDALRALARIAAQKVLSKNKQDLPIDPRDPVFASEYIRECDRLLANTPLLLQDALESAGYAAEGTNVDPYQGVVEVLQNAEDRNAAEVRIMLRQAGPTKQMLIAHNGLPVQYEHVLAMMLPFVSTKRDDADLWGRFGIGLKTLRRICTDIQVHGSPYHFGSSDAVSIVERTPENPIADFYDPSTDTLLVLNLDEDFDGSDFQSWFGSWTDDGLIFLDHVRRFELRRGDEEPLAHSTEAGAWIDVPEKDHELARLQRRTVTAGNRVYLVHRGQVQVPMGQERFHKRTGATTRISIATGGVEEDRGIFVGFRTRIPTAFPFAIDAQFDPIASREGIQDNKWNAWLLGQLGAVLAHAAANALADAPSLAWNLVPVPSEGVRDERWPAEALASAFEIARSRFAEIARFGPDRERRLSEVAYEDEALSDLLAPEDVANLAPGNLPLPPVLRDSGGRWRTVIDALGASRKISPADVIKGASEGAFERKDSEWWIGAAATLAAACEPEQIFAAPIWLCDDGKLVACQPTGSSDRKLVFGASLPSLARRYRLFDVLHPAFSSGNGRAAVDWLVRHAAFTSEVDAQDELLAFASAFEDDPIRLSPEGLRELRDLLDPLSGARAQKVGERLGQAVLIEAVEAETKGQRSWRRPPEVYLPKAIDKDTPHWPHAAWGIPGIYWAHPRYDDGLRTGLGRRRKRADGTRSRGARSFLSLLGAETGPRLVHGADLGERSASRRASMAGANATKLSSDIWSTDIDKVLRAITNKKLPKKDRKERAVALLRSLSRDWSRRLHEQSTVGGEHTARVYTYPRGTHDALWLDRLKETAWIPVGRDRFRKPFEAAVRTAETQAIYKSDEFVTGITAEELDEDLVDALELTARVRVSDLLAMLEDMRDDKESFDANRVYLAYQHFARLMPKTAWITAVGDVSITEFRTRFSAKNGLVLVVADDGIADWRRPTQVRRGKPIIPNASLYVSDRESFRPLWKALGIGETNIDDCCEYLKLHAERFDTTAEQGVVIQIYRYMSTLLTGRDEFPASCRHVPLACFNGWRARRPIYLVEDPLLRDRLATALQELFFWQPPCETRSIQKLIEALAVQRMLPRVRPLPDQRAKEQGEDLTPTFQAAVDHLSNSLGKRDANLRQALTVSWDALRSAKLYVYDGEIPVDVQVDQLRTAVRTDLQAHVSLEPLEFHITSEGLELREAAGVAMAALFESANVFSFDAEWILAWQAAKREVANALLFTVDDAAHKAKIDATAGQIGQKGSGPVKLSTRKAQKDSSNPPPPPARELKDFQPGISSVEVVEGKPPKKLKPAIKPKLRKRLKPGRAKTEERVANTSYTNVEIEDFAWEVLVHVLDRADGTELEDFRRRHGVGADGAFDWGDFVELKATGRSMQTSVSFTPAEFKRALERGNDYILALVHNCEKGNSTKVKLIFDPVRRVSIRETEAIRLNGLPDAAGIIVELGEHGEMSSIEDKQEPEQTPGSDTE